MKNPAMIKNVTIDKGSCIGCGACADVAPEFFEISPQGNSQVVKDSLSRLNLHGGDTQKESVLLRSAQSCPVRAISLFDENGIKIYPKN